MLKIPRNLPWPAFFVASWFFLWALFNWLSSLLCRLPGGIWQVVFTIMCLEWVTTYVARLDARGIAWNLYCFLLLEECVLGDFKFCEIYVFHLREVLIWRFFLVNLAIGCWLQRLKQPFFSPDSFHHRHGFFSRRWRWDVIHSWKTATVSYRHGHPGVLLKTVIQCRLWCPVMVIPYSLGRLLQPAMSVGFLGLSCWWVHLT